LPKYLFSTVGRYTPYVYLVVYMMPLGGGIGILISPSISAVMGSVAAQRTGVASAFRARFFGVSFTISLNLAISTMTSTVPYALIINVILSPSHGATREMKKDTFS